MVVELIPKLIELNIFINQFFTQLGRIQNNFTQGFDVVNDFDFENLISIFNDDIDIFNDDITFKTK